MFKVKTPSEKLAITALGNFRLSHRNSAHENELNLTEDSVVSVSSVSHVLKEGKGKGSV